ncbi:MAG: hypothetical protein LBU88_03040 [Treponema sp.]|jgi:hypothetical protein|nr:hypothetical protein [Treponema sp.]
MKKQYLIFLILPILFLFSCNRDKTPPVLELPFVNAEIPSVKEDLNEFIDTSVLKPVITDPGLILNWQKENWRIQEYEIFSWDIFADTTPILIFDYADYGVQNRMLKRLAFYVEKAGFRGQLWHDSDIAHLHGWNAHNYRDVDLARFFDTARKTGFPLLDEEWELEKLLLNEKIIRRENGNIVPGKGAILSIARESTESLRRRFLAHEGFHGLYFVDNEFRNFCRRRWEGLSEPAKIFLTAYFDHQQYDTKDEYLLINEFMGHIMQQPISQAADYFGRNLPSRLENTMRASDLPPKDNATGTWPELALAFTSEAQALSDYVNLRWGFTAGRAWSSR